MEHILEEHENCEIVHCNICEGGLAFCTVCNSGEGALPSECPGEPMTFEQSEEIFAGVLDYKDGAWVILPKKYKFKTIKDLYEKVPVDRIETCLKELAVILIQSKHLENAMCLATNEITGKMPDRAFAFPDEIVWVDDGEAELTSRVVTKEGEEVFKMKTKL